MHPIITDGVISQIEFLELIIITFPNAYLSIL